MRYEEIFGLIGNTPLFKIEDGIYGKIEYMNPTGSHKDRTALYMVRDASKKLKKGRYLIEYTSGNTGISVAFVSRIMGYKSLILVPENISDEKINLIKGLRGEVRIIKEGEDGHEYVRKLEREINGVYLNQTENLANFKAHYETTGVEIYGDLKDISSFVMGVGTGGTIYGIGKYLKEKNDKIKVIALIPKGSFLQEEFFGKKDEDEQIFEGFSYYSFSGLFKRALDEGIVDDVRITNSEESIRGMRELLGKGLMGGMTSGAHYYHARKLRKELGGKVVTIIADSILRYPKILKRLINYD